jgi:hypothetical protein
MAIPNRSAEAKIKGNVPTVLKKIANVTVVKERAMTRLVPPIFATSGIRNAAPAKHKIERDVRKEEAKELMWY